MEIPMPALPESQPRYQSQYKPLLTHGFATWGFVYQYSSSAGGEDYEFTASYAWLDAEGKLQVRHLEDGYDAIHAAYGRGLGSIVVDTDAERGEDVELVILHDLKTGEHIPYRALRANPRLRTRAAPSHPPLHPRTAHPSARRRPPPSPASEEVLSGTAPRRCSLATGLTRAAQAVRADRSALSAWNILSRGAMPELMLFRRGEEVSDGAGTS
ncbi:MAG TPA: hypothetical protein VK539_00400 [Myxococcaceae bacterium]|nr:hypothetical protein [Myxococcaceae bacterium]